MTAAGFVLTGGASRRMGQDKAMLPYLGRTLVEVIAGEVQNAAGSVSLVGATERYQHLGLSVLPEDFSGCGPLSGIESALRHNFAQENLIVGCDMAGVQADWLKDLIAFADAHPEAPVVVPVSPDGQVHSLCAVWHSCAHAPIRVLLSNCKYKLTDALQEIGFVSHRAAWTTELRNINTPKDWEAVTAR